MASDKEILEWAKEKYPQYMGNIELLRSLYKRQVEKESVFKYKKLPLKRIVDLNDGKKYRVKAVVIEIRKKGEKNKKWFSVIIGDSSMMERAFIFLDRDRDDIVEGSEYIFKLNKSEEKGVIGDVEREVTSEESMKIDEIYDYIYELNGGRVNKDKFISFVGRRGYTPDYVIDLFGLEDEGEVVVGR